MLHKWDNGLRAPLEDSGTSNALLFVNDKSSSETSNAGSPSGTSSGCFRGEGPQTASFHLALGRGGGEREFEFYKFERDLPNGVVLFEF